MEPLRPEDRVRRAAGSSRRCIGEDVWRASEEATRRQPRPERRLAGVEERERQRPKPTRATQRESTGNEAARVRRRLPAPPLSFSAENKVPSLATAPAPTKDVVSPLGLRVYRACAGASLLRSFLFFVFHVTRC